MGWKNIIAYFYAMHFILLFVYFYAIHSIFQQVAYIYAMYRMFLYCVSHSSYLSKILIWGPTLRTCFILQLMRSRSREVTRIIIIYRWRPCKCFLSSKIIWSLIFSNLDVIPTPEITTTRNCIRIYLVSYGGHVPYRFHHANGYRWRKQTLKQDWQNFYEWK